MKVHIGVDAGTGCVHTVTATAANIHDVDEIPNLLRPDDELKYAIAEYAYSWYNQIRPHSYNNYLTPFEARFDLG